MASNISDKILDKIKEKKITPKPKWQFRLKNYVFWAAFGASIAIGSLTFAVILHCAFENDWDVYRYLDKNLVSFIFISLPYFWIIFLALILAADYYEYKHTKSGYRYRGYFIVLGSVAVSFILGAGSFYFGMGKMIDEIFAKQVPYYHGMIRYKQEIWSHPEQGLLAGKIKRITDEKNFNIEDFKGGIWEVRGENIIWHKMPQIEEEVKLIGEKGSGCCIFRLKEARSWTGKEIRGKEEKKEDAKIKEEKSRENEEEEIKDNKEKDNEEIDDSEKENE
jgi:hypothetical protein